MRIAVYAGSFDPFTLGHRSVVRQGLHVFDRVVVLVADNPDKQYIFTPEERLDFARWTVAELGDIQVEYTSGYVAHFARRIGASALLRGIRGATDAEAEVALATGNRELAPEVQTVLVPAHKELASVSSSELRRRAKAGEDGSAFCHPEVWKRLVARGG